MGQTVSRAGAGREGHCWPSPSDDAELVATTMPITCELSEMSARAAWFDR